jgi:CheY-like chemotaxis protein
MDDRSVDIRDTLADFLEDEGYSVGAAANGREALAYSPRNSFAKLAERAA